MLFKVGQTLLCTKTESQCVKDALKCAHAGCRPIHLNLYHRTPLYFPYLLFGRGSKKRLGGVSLAWLSLRDLVGRRRGMRTSEEEEGRNRGSKVFVLSAVW